MGVPGYPGATPSWIIWNLLERYTREGDLVIDPFAGGGTTNDVAASLGRRAWGFDLQPQKPVGIALADARRLPLRDACADFAFLDPPYPLAEDVLAADLKALTTEGWLVPGALIVVERSVRSPEPTWPEEIMAGREKRYGETVLWYGLAAPESPDQTEE